MIVICLDGEEKSTSPLSQQLQMAGFSVLGSVLLEEEFPQMKPGSFGAENIWISGWIERLLQKKIEVGEDSERAVLFFDHSPFMKSDNITELGPLIEAQLADLKRLAGISTCIVWVASQGSPKPPQNRRCDLEYTPTQPTENSMNLFLQFLETNVPGFTTEGK